MNEVMEFYSHTGETALEAKRKSKKNSVCSGCSRLHVSLQDSGILSAVEASGEGELNWMMLSQKSGVCHCMVSGIA